LRRKNRLQKHRNDPLPDGFANRLGADLFPPPSGSGEVDAGCKSFGAALNARRQFLVLPGRVPRDRGAQWENVYDFVTDAELRPWSNDGDFLEYARVFRPSIPTAHQKSGWRSRKKKKGG